jgi:hypothetical protein
LADQRITQLTALPKASVASNDALPVADISASQTKKVTVKDLVDAGLDLVDASSIDLSKLDQSSATKLGTAAIADSSISAAKLAADSTIAVQATTPTTSNYEGRGYFNSASGNLQIFNGASYAQVVLPTGGIADSAVTTAKIADGAVTTDKVTALGTAALADGAVTQAKLADLSISTSKYQAASIDATAIGANAVTTPKIQDNAVTFGKIQQTTDTDKLLGRASAGAGTIEEIACTAAGRALLDDTDAAAQRTTLGLGTVATVNVVTADELGTQAVTAVKLANESTVDLVTTLPPSGVFTGQLALNTSNNTVYCWSGSTWVAIKAAGSINSIVSDNAGLVNTQITIAGDVATVSTSIDNTTGAAQFLAGPTGAAGAVDYRTIAGSDLPAPTISSRGAVVVNGNGLTMVSDTIAIDNTVTASGSNYHVVQYNTNGLVTNGRLIASGDLPLATELAAGAILPGSGLSITTGGVLNHTNNVVAGSGTKVTFDVQGHITGTEPLVAADIPSLDASKITTGTFGSTFLAPNSVTAEQLADYGIAQVSETAPTPEFAGQWWINPSDRSAYIWVGTVTPSINGYWLLVGYGSPTQLNLRFGGTYNANTNTVVTLNQYGTEAGLTVGQALGAPNSQNNGVYLAVTTAGTGTTPAPVASLAVGDWVLSQGTGANWTKVAVVSGATGTFNDYDILCDGAYFNPDMPAVADVRDALELIWGRVQIATTSQIGAVKESAEVLVDNSTGEMSIGVVDDGSY